MSIVFDAARNEWLDDATGKALSVVALIDARDVLADDYEAELAALGRRFAGDEITIDEWAEQFLNLVFLLVAHGYVFGRGGVEQMEERDWAEVARIFEDQRTYADDFIVEVKTMERQRGNVDTVLDYLSYKQDRLIGRMQLYAGGVIRGYEEASVRRVFRRGDGEATLSLPFYPTEGTECQSRCRCYWLVVENDREQHWRVRWVSREDQGVCPTCQLRASAYRDLTVAYDVRSVDWLDLDALDDATLEAYGLTVEQITEYRGSR